MKNLALLIAAVCVTGCSVFLPVKPKFPEPVKELTEPCPDLAVIKGDTVAVTDLLKAVVNNYNLYYECSLKNEGWNEWYKIQRQIYDKIK
jgi:hypothetical protein